MIEQLSALSLDDALTIFYALLAGSVAAGLVLGVVGFLVGAATREGS